MNYIKIFVFIFFVFTMNLFGNSAVVLTEKEKKWLSKNPVITLATNNHRPPGVIYDKINNTHSGYHIEYLELLEKILGVKFDISYMNWADAVQKAKDHRVDGLFPAAISEDRKPYLKWSESYIQTPLVFAGKKDTPKIKTEEDLKYKRVSVNKGSTYIELLQDISPDIEIILTDTPLEAIAAVIEGEADYVINSIIVLNHQLQNNTLGGVIGIKHVYYSDNHGHGRIAVRNNAPELLSILNKGIGAISSEKVNEIKRKWINIQKDESLLLSKKEKEYLAKKGKINLCIRADLYPIDGIKEGKHIGIFGEYFNVISQKTGINFELVPTSSIQQAKDFMEQKRCDLLTGLPKQQKFIKNTVSSESFFETYPVIVSNIERKFTRDIVCYKNDKFVVNETFYKNYLKEIYPELDVEHEDDFKKMMDKVVENKVYSTILLNEIADRFIDEYGYQKLKISGYIGDENMVEMGMLAQQNDPILLGIMNKAIQSIPKETIKEIQNQYQYTRYHDTTDYSLVWQIVGASVLVILVVIIVVFTLKRDNRKLHELIDSTIEGMIISKEGRVLDGNYQLIEMFGYESIDEVKDLYLLDFVEKSYHGFVKENFKLSQKPYEIVAIRKDKTVFPALVKGTILDDGRRVSTILDITKLKTTQEELHELNKNLEERVQSEVDKNKIQQAMMLQQSRLAQMGEMLNMIAHQWRQPLNNLSLLIQLINRKYTRDNLKGKDMDSFKDDSSKYISFMSQTIDDFKNFFKPEKEKTRFDLCEAVNATIQLVGPALNDRGIKIYFQCNEKILLEGYPNELGQALVNLINNSKDAFLENPAIKDKKIDINIEVLNNKVLLNILDNAGGINEEYIEKVFEPYFSTKLHKNGTGLGMYMTKMIIEEHMGGTVKIQNAQDGLEVIILLPM